MYIYDMWLHVLHLSHICGAQITDVQYLHVCHSVKTFYQSFTQVIYWTFMGHITLHMYKWMLPHESWSQLHTKEHWLCHSLVLYFHIHVCVQCAYMCMHAQEHVHVKVWSWYQESSLFIMAGSLIQTWNSPIRLVLLASLLWGSSVSAFWGWNCIQTAMSTSDIWLGFQNVNFGLHVWAANTSIIEPSFPPGHNLGVCTLVTLLRSQGAYPPSQINLLLNKDYPSCCL